MDVKYAPTTESSKGETIEKLEDINLEENGSSSKKQPVHDKDNEPDQSTELLQVTKNSKYSSDRSTDLQEKGLSSSFAQRTWKHHNFSKVVHTIILYCVML